MAKDRSHVQHRYIELFLNSSPGRKQDSGLCAQRKRQSGVGRGVVPLCVHPCYCGQPSPRPPPSSPPLHFLT
uniref:Uncharacterized protein n=1 Tax=Gopherus evgoodei TaxID=1825980 RepID=A0A8C4W0J9_9SAUR